MSSRGTLLWAFGWLCAASVSLVLLLAFATDARADDSSSVYRGSYRDRQCVSRDSHDNYSARNDVKQTGHAEPMRSREYFDPRGDDPRYAMRGRPISHAVHQEPTLADGVIIDGCAVDAAGRPRTDADAGHGRSGRVAAIGCATTVGRGTTRNDPPRWRRVWADGLRRGRTGSDGVRTVRIWSFGIWTSRVWAGNGRTRRLQRVRRVWQLVQARVFS